MEIFEYVSIGLVCLLSIYIISSFFRYSREGDLTNSLEGIDKLYNTGDTQSVIKQLFELVVLEKSKVRWPVLMAVSIVFAIFITYSIRGIENEPQRFIIVLFLMFIPLYITFNYLQAHGGNKSMIHASQLYAIGKISEMSKTRASQEVFSSNSKGVKGALSAPSKHANMSTIKPTPEIEKRIRRPKDLEHLKSIKRMIDKTSDTLTLSKSLKFPTSAKPVSGKKKLSSS